MNHHILTIHKTDYNGSLAQLELALSIRIESVNQKAALMTQADEITIELTLTNGTYAQATDLRQFAEGVMLAQELSHTPKLIAALETLCGELHRGRKYNAKKDFDLLLADAAARRAIYDATHGA